MVSVARFQHLTRRRQERGDREGDRNDAQRAPSERLGFSALLSLCAQSSRVVVARSSDFTVGFDEDGGLKNRCGFRRKSWIRQVLISRTLRGRGEVAERLKAAVC